jgi:hypothetical protein
VDLPHFNVNYETLLPEKIQRSFGRLKASVGNLGVRRSNLDYRPHFSKPTRLQ